MPRLLLLMLALAAVPASATIYKWVDENGKVQYSDKPPSMIGKQGMTELNSRGMTVKKLEGALTPEQKAAREAEQAKEKELQAKQDEARRRDKALLNSFSNTREIDRIRDQNVDQLTAGIQSDQLRRDAVQKRIDEYIKQQDRFTQAKKPAPAYIVGELADRKDELAEIDGEIQQKKQELEDVKLKAEADKKRLIELRGPSAIPK